MPPRYPRRTFQAEGAAGRKAGIRQTQQERDGAMDVQMSSGWVGPQRGQAPFSPCPKLKTVEICDHQHIKSHLFLFLEGLAEVGRGCSFPLEAAAAVVLTHKKVFPGLENLEKSDLLHVILLFQFAHSSCLIFALWLKCLNTILICCIGDHGPPW